MMEQKTVRKLERELDLMAKAAVTVYESPADGNWAAPHSFLRREQPQLIVFPDRMCTFLTVCFLPQSHRHTTLGLVPCPLRSFITVRRPNRFPVKSMKGGIPHLAFFVLGVVVVFPNDFMSQPNTFMLGTIAWVRIRRANWNRSDSGPVTRRHNCRRSLFDGFSTNPRAA